MATLKATGSVDGVALAAATLDIIPVPAALVEFRNFAQKLTASQAVPSVGLFIAKSLDGNGATYRMVPHTSTRAADVAKITPTTKPNTNPFVLMAVGGNSAAERVTNPAVGNLSIEGTDQDHLYGGLAVKWSTGARIYKIPLISGIPGTSGSPPGETFSLSTWHSDAALIEEVNIDGMGIAASLFGLNTSKGQTVQGCSAIRNAFGTGLTSWQCSDVLVEDFIARYCRRPLNIEDPWGPHVYRRIDCRDAANGPHLTCNSQGVARGCPTDSVKLEVIDPLWNTAKGPFRIGVIEPGGLYNGKPQTQKIADVRVWMGGKEVTGDPSKVLIGNQWNKPV